MRQERRPSRDFSHERTITQRPRGTGSRWELELNAARCFLSGFQTFSFAETTLFLMWVLFPHIITKWEFFPLFE